MDSNYIPKMSDHFLVQSILGKVIEDLTGRPLVNMANTDEMPDYPYFSFNWIDLGKDTTTDWLGVNEQYVSTMQIDVHDSDPDRAQQLSRKLYRALRSVNYQRVFNQAQIVPQNITNTSNRTVILGSYYDYRYGFDCSFLINGGQEYDFSKLKFDYSTTDIKTVTTGMSYGSKNGSFDVPRKSKEEK
ncbi:hypothetical protein EJK17_09025 [Lactobacillus xujianguonis]|uniref:Phage neck terminator protein gp12-like domain-containing protein n=1 Tax=Lactobacillus xujianguonis TaxID=2495899 RepID=A0A437STG9_9LACO|nr:hypothetical protein [Lactobacillus xujianguonis]RVU70164.1 hypothetical protein EJK17_09025 [Lactobacillus xujianguonis]RVU73531.1 hypothetical protein EJK20_07815 [Lactobacillus xujianguonis]